MLIFLIKTTQQQKNNFLFIIKPQELSVKSTSPPSAPCLPEHAASDSLLLDRAAADRALDFYLPNTTALQLSSSALLTVPNRARLQTALILASDLLRCAGVKASEAGNGLSGRQRDRILSMINMVDMARCYVDTSLDTLTSSWELNTRRTD